MTTKNFRVRNGLSIAGATSGSSNFSNNATGADIDYVLPTAQGTASTALTNDGSGNLTWALPGGGGSTFGNITIAVVDDNTISTTSGNLVLDSTSGTITMNSAGTLGVTLNPIAGFNPNADFTGNIVKGVIRTGAGEATGDIWQSVGPVNQATGISIDNTDKPADRTNLVIRNYGAGLTAGAPRLGVIGESARGTAAVPLNLNSGNVLIDIFGNGYTNLGWATDLGATIPSLLRLTTTEAWTNGLNNTGTGLLLLTQPTATALSAASLQATIQANPQFFNCRSDNYTWSNGKTGTTQRMSLDVNGNLTLSGGNLAMSNGSSSVQLNNNNGPTGPTLNMNFGGTGLLQVGDVNIIQAGSTWQSAFSPGFKYNGLGSSGSANITANGTLFEMSPRWKASAATPVFDPPQIGWGIGAFQFSADNSTTNTSQLVAGQIRCSATENWTSTAIGTKMTFEANKAGTLNSTQVLDMSPIATTFRSDAYTIEDSVGTDYLVMNGTSNTFYQPVGFPVYTIAGKPATGVVGQQISISDSPTSGGRMAFWDTTNSRWSYISDNSAV